MEQFILKELLESAGSHDPDEPENSQKQVQVHQKKLADLTREFMGF